MKKRLVRIIIQRVAFSFLAFSFCFVAKEAGAQAGGAAGTFTNMGYGARGIALGNSGTALTTGDPLALYNPAFSAFQNDRSVNASYSALGLDRTFEVLSFTGIIPVYKKTPGMIKDTIPDSLRERVSTIGISAGAVTTGVGNIDQRDADGMPLGATSTYQDFFYGSVAIRFKPQLAVGVMVKFLEAKLADQITSGGVGVDIGAVYQVSDALSVAAVVQNMFASYRWDSTPLYNEQGQTTTDPFPVYFHFGAAYHVPESGATITADFEQSSVNTSIIRGGAEYAFNSAFIIRAGVDGFDLANRVSEQVHPSFGLTFKQPLGAFTPAFDYAAYIDPVVGLINVVSLSFQF